MKRSPFAYGLTILLLPVVAHGELRRYWHPTLGDLVVYDDVSGLAWMGDMSEDSITYNLFYADQLAVIANMNVAADRFHGLSGWHMASEQELETLVRNPISDVGSRFDLRWFGNTGATVGRYENFGNPPQAGKHHTFTVTELTCCEPYTGYDGFPYVEVIEYPGPGNDILFYGTPVPTTGLPADVQSPDVNAYSLTAWVVTSDVSLQDGRLYPRMGLSVSPTSLSASCTQGEDAASDSFKVWNSGGGTLNYTVGESISWLSCTPTNGTSAGEKDTITVNYTSAGLAKGTYSGMITVTAGGASGSPKTVTVTLTVIPGPELSVSPTALFPSCFEGENASSGQFAVWNSGGGSLTYTVTEGLGWLSCSSTGGTIEGGTNLITVSYTTAGLPAGDYHGTITVTAPGASGSPQEVAVALQVLPAPQLSVSPTTLTPECIEGENAPSDYFEIWNSGGQTLNYTITESISWLNCTPTSGNSSSGEHDSIAVNYNATGLPAGTYNGTITVTAAGAHNSPQTVAVTLTVIPAPELSVSPTTLTPQCTLGGTATNDYFEVWNSSGGALMGYTVSESISWLSCTPTSGASAGEHDVITVTYSPDGLAAGTYHETITVTAAGADNSPQTVAVTLTVIPPSAQLAVGPPTLLPRCDKGEDAPSEVFEVWNSGAGTLSYTISESIDWLSCTPTNGTSTGDHVPITVNYSTAGLAPGPGFYSGTITVTAPGASGSPQEVTVQLRVGSMVFCSLGVTPSNTFSVTWPGGPGAWLERSSELGGTGWSTVPSTEGASRIEVPMTSRSAFFRVYVSSQALLVTEHPVSVAVAEGEPAFLSVVAESIDAPAYRWRFHGTNLPGATNPTLYLPSVQTANVGDYDVVLSNSSRSITSSPAVVVITAPLGHLVRIPADTFVMGSPDSEVDRDPDESPQTTVTLTHGFWMGTYEVTQEEYVDVMGSNPSYFTGVNQPVEFMGWTEATNYCAILTQRERTAGRIPASLEYRLPTEAEWEYACRAGTKTRFSYGEDPGYSNLTEYAWCSYNSTDTTHPVGQKLANPWGLYDMHGNVWEWCLDWYTSYPGGSVTNPSVDSSIGFRPIVRGGSYYYGGAPARSANRGAMDPPTGMRWDVGLRVVLAPTSP